MGKFDINSTVRMNSGYDIPLLGYGVYQTPMDVAEEVTAHAVKSGYRHADSAAAYRNEQPTAAGLLKAGLPRSELFFTSKVPPKAINYDAAKAVVDESLKLTGLEYIDLYLLHAPYGGKENRLGAWKALVEAVEAGKVRSIGVSNYGVHHLEELEEWIKQTEEKEGKGKGGVLSVNQVELHPWLARDDIVQWCTKRGVVMEVWYSCVSHPYSLLTSPGILSSCPRDQDRRPFAYSSGQEIQQDNLPDPTPLGSPKGNSTRIL